MCTPLRHKSKLERVTRYRPAVAVNVQNTLLARIISMAEGVSQYHFSRKHWARETRRQRKRKRTSNPSASEDQSTDVEPIEPITATSPQLSLSQGTRNVEGTSIADKPPVLDHFTFGINEVTRLLEDTSKSSRRRVIVDETGTAEQPNRQFSGLVLVCRGDVDPPILISHLPYLVAACNSAHSHSGTTSQPTDQIWLVPLSKGAEISLTHAMGLRRVSVMAVDVS